MARFQQVELVLLQQRFQLEHYTTLTRVPPETYLINEEPHTIIPLPSLKRAPEPEKELVLDDTQPSSLYQQPPLKRSSKNCVPMP